MMEAALTPSLGAIWFALGGLHCDWAVGPMMELELHKDVSVEVNACILERHLQAMARNATGYVRPPDAPADQNLNRNAS